MNAHYRTTVLIAVIVGLISQVHGQNPESQPNKAHSPAKAAARWRIIESTDRSHSPTVKTPRGGVSLRLRDPATAYRKTKSMETQSRPASRPQRPVRRTEAAVPTARTVAQPSRAISRPTYQVAQPESLVAPRMIRLVQAESNNSDVEDLLKDLDDLVKESDSASNEGFDNLLEQAKDLLESDEASIPATQPEAPSDNVLDGLDLPSLDGPDQDVEDSQTPQQMRDRLKEELDKLLDDEGDVDEDDPLGLQETDDEDDEAALKVQEAKEKALIDGLVDPKPDAVYRRPRRESNMPYTLSSVLGEEDRYDPACEAEYCRRVWECAGGRNMSTLARWSRGFNRDRMVRNSVGGLANCNPMKNFKCPKCPNVSPQMNGAMPYFEPARQVGPRSEFSDAEFQPFPGTVEPLNQVFQGQSPLPASEAPLERPPMGLLEPVQSAAAK